MKTNKCRIAAVLSAAILAFYVGLCPRAHAGDMNVEAVPEGIGAGVGLGQEITSPNSMNDLSAGALDTQLPSDINFKSAESAAITAASAEKQAAPAVASAEASGVTELPAAAAELHSAGQSADTLSAASAASDVSQPEEGAAVSEEALAKKPMNEQVAWAQKVLLNVRKEWDNVIVGQTEAKDAILTGLVTRQSVFLESAPGLGKTKLAEAVATSINTDFGRVQGTPDLLPSDITGATVLTTNAKGEKELKFQQGPIFKHLVLVDEMNRMAPKTQSGLLQGMEERQVSVQGETYKTPLHMVIATQNPLEEQGVYPLPFATLDRFLFKVLISKPTEEELGKIRAINVNAANKPKTQKVADLETMDRVQRVALKLGLTPEVGNYIDRIVVAANNRPELKPGHVISPRVAIGMELASRVHALLRGSEYVTPDDVQAVTPLILRHRLIMNYETEQEGVTADALTKKILDTVAIDKTKPAQ